ncbi:hypothetical protein F3Y22_tig00111014pilonHSYRG00028 [Hibiscus syriacus]|uniref:Uncharacterized protein n=1 Tax=Hibiscus syriacus TaxID=106335 RepID=A0A6A2Z7E6_HIBSY|nr:hypothetical protein F3Y22_tig00111014pilonHSYRG00028 [Hibiscus syriacus]
MASSDKELELLLEAGNSLLEPPSSVDELITLLDQVESFLSRVEQAPSQSMQNAISPSLKALIAEQLFRHPDTDLKLQLVLASHFLNAIRDYHADTVFTSMLTIMTLVLEESEDISMELLSPILARVKKDNEEVLPIARKLAKSVLENCASKLKPYLTQAVESLGIAYEDYSVVASICQVAPNAVVQNDDATDKRVFFCSRHPSKACLVLAH